MNKVVIGLGFGDEGKGLVVDYLSSQTQNPLVVRFSGGQQAGHTVRNESTRHVFSNFGSGTLSGIPSYWSKYCTMDPIGIKNEYEDLIKTGCKPILYIDAKTPITTPCDTFYNREFNKAHGTVGVGVGPTLKREEDNHHLLFEDLFHPTAFDIKLKLIYLSYYGIGKLTYTKELTEYSLAFNKAVNFIRECPSIRISYGLPNFFNNYIFEGSQGLLLDKDIGFFPHVTRSNTDLTNVLKMASGALEVYYVTRAYQTRHGNGPMTNEDVSHSILNDPDETNVTHKFQGEFRRSILDLDLLSYTLAKVGPNQYFRKILVITCLDHLKEFAYTIGGKKIVCKDQDDFVHQVQAQLRFSQVLTSNTPFSTFIKDGKEIKN